MSICGQDEGRERGEVGVVRSIETFHPQQLPEPQFFNRALRQLIGIEVWTTGLQWLPLLHTYVNRRLFKHELLYVTTDSKPRSSGRGSAFPTLILLLPISPTDMQSHSLVFPSPMGFAFYKEKNTEFICALRVMDSPLLLLGKCIQTLWKRPTLPNPALPFPC